jgi:hypothetical protein
MLGAGALARAGRALVLRGSGTAPLRLPPLRQPVHGSAGGGAGSAGGLSFVPAFPIGVFSGGVGSFVGIGGALLMVPLTGRLYNLRQLQVRAPTPARRCNARLRATPARCAGCSAACALRACF